MQIRAASIGSFVPRENFDATIQSVFDSSLNLRLDDRDFLLTLLVSDGYDLPQGIRIATTNPLPALTVGGVAACRGGVLRFDSVPFAVDLRGAPVWESQVKSLGADMRAPSAQAAWAAVWDALNHRQRRVSAEVIANDLMPFAAGSPLSRRLGAPLFELMTSADSLDASACAEAARAMIGLGPGVTPSGDDILIGFLAGLWSTAGKDWKRISFIESFGNELANIAQNTNEISRTYLALAAQGQFSSSLSRLTESIAGGAEDLAEAAEAAMRVGHSSGMDSVTGLLIGLAAWVMISPSPLFPFAKHPAGLPLGEGLG